jgi:predicted acylesterase/phospholipase RssA
VLDRLLADDRIEIEAVSGTSAGAVNAVVMAEGLVEGGRSKARQQLADFWQRVAFRLPDASVAGWNLDNGWTRSWEKAWGIEQNPAVILFGWWTQLASPYQFNPLNINPLREILVSEVNFDEVKACDCIQLFITATNVRTGKAKVFTDGEVTADAVLASACLPTVFQAVEIDGEAYWDGGYMGNPAIEPFLGSCAASDVLLVQINPIRRDELPKSALAIIDRRTRYRSMRAAARAAQCGIHQRLPAPRRAQGPRLSRDLPASRRWWCRHRRLFGGEQAQQRFQPDRGASRPRPQGDGRMAAAELRQPGQGLHHAARRHPAAEPPSTGAAGLLSGISRR